MTARTSCTEGCSSLTHVEAMYFNGASLSISLSDSSSSDPHMGTVISTELIDNFLISMGLVRDITSPIRWGLCSIHHCTKTITYFHRFEYRWSFYLAFKTWSTVVIYGAVCSKFHLRRRPRFISFVSGLQRVQSILMRDIHWLPLTIYPRWSKKMLML